MADYYAIILSKENKYIGTLLMEESRYETFGIYKHVQLLIDNYNKNLVSIADNIPKEVLAHRFLERENEACNLQVWWALLAPDTNYYVKNNIRDYSWPNLSDQKIDFGNIGLVKSEIKDLWSRTKYKVVINLDLNEIITFNLIRREDQKAYCVRNGLSKISKKRLKEFVITDIDATKFKFNQVEDVINLLEDNPDGWCYEDTSSIYTSCYRG